MNRVLGIAAVLLVCAAPGFSSSGPHSANSNHQFQFSASSRNRLAQDHVTLQEFANAHDHASPLLPRAMQAQRRLSRPRPHVNPPAGKIGFVSAAQIPAILPSTGGGVQTNAQGSNGDFNGDGKQDLITIVQDDSSNLFISAVLSNGDGSFQPPQLTPVPGNNFVAFAVGDLNGDGKDDVVIVHAPTQTPTPANLDVLLSNGDGTFTEPPAGNYSLGTTNPLVGGALQDVNADGKLDAVVVDSASPNVVWTLLGNGDGTFAASATSVALPSGSEVNALLVDMNGDGQLDVVGESYNSGTNTSYIDVYLATSATSYGAPTSTQADPDICNALAGDLNGDGFPDVVTSNCADNTITIFLNSSGVLQAGVNYPAALNGTGNSAVTAAVFPQAATIADVNGDGFPDIISTNGNGNQGAGVGDITVLLGNGHGAVSSPNVGYAPGGYPQTPAIVADFNGDGFPDIAVLDREFGFAYMKGYGDGTFRAALDYYSASQGTSLWGMDVAAGDFNGDGRPDVVLGNYCYTCNPAAGITVFLSNPDGSLQPGVTYGSSSTLEYVAVADFNGDGKLDIAASDNSNGVVQIFTGNGDGTFTAGSTFVTAANNNGPTDLVVGDFNKDGHPDLAVLNTSNPYDVGVLINDGTGNFLPPVNYTLSNSVQVGITAADINGDGNLDILAPLSGSTAIAVLTGNGDGTFSTTEIDIPAGGSSPGAVAVADLNGDGNPDIAVTLDNGGGQDIAVIWGLGGGAFTANPTILASSLQDFTFQAPYPAFIKAIDVDGDGILDLVYDNNYYGTVGVLFGAGSSQFSAPVEYPVSTYPWGMVAADVNKDGAPDIVTAGEWYASNVTVLLNNNGSNTLPNFTLGASQNSATVTAGQSATFNLSLSPINHYNGTVTFSCSGLPAKSTCSFSPANVTPTGVGQVATQLTITTTAATASLQIPAAPNRRNSQNLLASLSSIGVFGMMLAGGMRKKHRRWMGILLATALVAIMFSMVGCGSSSSSNGNNGNGGGTVPGTPSGTYTVVVSASGTASNNGGGAPTQTLNLSLTVQ